MIRDISLYDVTAICDMLIQLRDESPVYRFVETDEDHVPEYLRCLITAPSFIGLIDEDYRGFMFGHVDCHWYSKRIDAFEQLLYVSPEHRGGSLAARLIRGFELSAKGRGATTLYAGATTGVADDRTIRLYQALGYRTTLPAVRKEL